MAKHRMPDPPNEEYGKQEDVRLGLPPTPMDEYEADYNTFDADPNVLRAVGVISIVIGVVIGYRFLRRLYNQKL